MHPQARLQDDFAWRVKMPAHLILLLTFLIPGEKVRSASGRQIAPTEPAGETVPCRGMSGNEGLWEPSHKKGSLGEKGLLSDSPRHAIACHPPLRGRQGPLSEGAVNAS